MLHLPRPRHHLSPARVVVVTRGRKVAVFLPNSPSTPFNLPESSIPDTSCDITGCPCLPTPPPPLEETASGAGGLLFSFHSLICSCVYMCTCCTPAMEFVTFIWSHHAYGGHCARGWGRRGEKPDEVCSGTQQENLESHK